MWSTRHGTVVTVLVETSEVTWVKMMSTSLYSVTAGPAPVVVDGSKRLAAITMVESPSALLRCWSVSSVDTSSPSSPRGRGRGRGRGAVSASALPTAPIWTQQRADSTLISSEQRDGDHTTRHWGDGVGGSERIKVGQIDVEVIVPCSASTAAWSDDLHLMSSSVQPGHILVSKTRPCAVTPSTSLNESGPDDVKRKKKRVGHTIRCRHNQYQPINRYAWAPSKAYHTVGWYRLYIGIGVGRYRYSFRYIHIYIHIYLNRVTPALRG